MTDQPDHIVDPGLLPLATETQARYLAAVNEFGGYRNAARAIGAPNHTSLVHAIQALRGRAAINGYAPDHDMIHTAPTPFTVKGTSTYYGRDGEARGQWVKTKLDDRAADQIFRQAIASELADYVRVTAMPAPDHTNANLLNLYTLTDCHVGMLAWHKEGGEDWDLAIAERILVGCFEQMILGAPQASTGVVNQLGDFLHYDGLVPITPTSGHVLDSEGRFSKMVGVAIRVLRRIVDLALLKHERVIVVMAEGNHDLASSVWLRLMFRALYENEPRVEVLDSELPYYAIQHGKTMLAFHHGHLKKPDQFPLTFAAQYPQMWGATTKRYAHAGHQHHKYVKEHGGMTVIQHPTLAARDAYASRGGWFAERAATAITYHDVFGEVASNTVSPEMLEAA
jgi:hypothetical protein